MKSPWPNLVAPFLRRLSWIQRILVTATAASIAWIIGNQVLPHGGLVAAIVATLTVRISLHKSIREGLGQLLGTSVGVATALLAIHFFGFGVIAVFATVILSLVTSRALHLSEVASINVPITALIVLGPGLAESTAVHRTVSTLIGTVIAIVFSYFAHPKTPAGRTVEHISALATKCADLLGSMSEQVVAGYSRESAGMFLARARLLAEEIPAVRAQALEARSYARWFPTAEKDEAEILYDRGISIEHCVVQTRTMSRTLFDSAFDNGYPASISKLIAFALSAASYAISQESQSIVQSHRDSLSRSVTGELRQAGSMLAAELIENVRDLEVGQFTRGISLVTNLEVIADSLDLDTPAITEVFSPVDMKATKKNRGLLGKYFRK